MTMDPKELGRHGAFAAGAPDGWQSGIDLRCYFAGQALLGLLACPGGGDDYNQYSPAKAAEEAVQFADALLAELAKG
jgi:hypothetical protein